MYRCVSMSHAPSHSVAGSHYINLFNYPQSLSWDCHRFLWVIPQRVSQLSFDYHLLSCFCLWQKKCWSWLPWLSLERTSPQRKRIKATLRDAFFACIENRNWCLSACIQAAFYEQKKYNWQKGEDDSNPWVSPQVFGFYCESRKGSRFQRVNPTLIS